MVGPGKTDQRKYSVESRTEPSMDYLSCGHVYLKLTGPGSSDQSTHSTVVNSIHLYRNEKVKNTDKHQCDTKLLFLLCFCLNQRYLIYFTHFLTLCRYLFFHLGQESCDCCAFCLGLLGSSLKYLANSEVWVLYIDKEILFNV